MHLQSRLLREPQAVGVYFLLYAVLGGGLEVVAFGLKDCIMIGFFIAGDHGAIDWPEEVGLFIFGNRGGFAAVVASHAVIGHYLRQLKLFPNLLSVQFLHDFLRRLETYLIFRAEKERVPFLAVGVNSAVLLALALDSIEEFLERKWFFELAFVLFIGRH